MSTKIEIEDFDTKKAILDKLRINYKENQYKIFKFNDDTYWIIPINNNRPVKIVTPLIQEEKRYLYGAWSIL